MGAPHKLLKCVRSEQNAAQKRHKRDKKRGQLTRGIDGEECGRLCGNSADSREWPTKRTGNRKGQCEREIKAKTIAIQRRNVFAEYCTLHAASASSCRLLHAPNLHTHTPSHSVYLPLSVPPSPTLAGHVRLICKTHVCHGSKGPPAAVHCRTGYTLAQRTLRSVCSGHR